LAVDTRVSHLLGKATDTAQVHRLVLDAAVPAGQQTGAGDTRS
jgi:hypothetical protein